MYRASHRLLVETQDRPCQSCRVRNSDLQDPARKADPVINPYQATQIETHHFPVERSLLDACDWRKVQQDYQTVKSQWDLTQWIDSPANLLVLCDVCHRSPTRGIHHLGVAAWFAQKYLLDGYVLAGNASDAAATQAELAHDQQVIVNQQPPQAPSKE